jgi:hypothetical protein
MYAQVHSQRDLPLEQLITRALAETCGRQHNHAAAADYWRHCATLVTEEHSGDGASAPPVDELADVYQRLGEAESYRGRAGPSADAYSRAHTLVVGATVFRHVTHVTSRHVPSSNVTSRHVPSFYVTSRHVPSSYVTPRHTAEFGVTSRSILVLLCCYSKHVLCGLRV